MPTVSRVLSSIFLVAGMISPLSAQEQPGTVPSIKAPLITAAESGENIRFVATPRVCQIRVEVLDANGVPLFDSSWQDGNVLDWPSSSPSLAAGTYRCVVQVRGLDGAMTTQKTTLVSDGESVAFQPQNGDAIAVVSPGMATPKITLLAHDGTNGSIVTTSGDLSFRFGNILLGKDAEKMHLTADGKLGIGTDKPQATLDVNGTIRAAGGILFDDGTILTSVNGTLTTRRSDNAGQPSTPGGPSGRWSLIRPAILPLVLRPHPLGPLTPHFLTTNTGVGIWNATPAYTLDVGGVINTSSKYDIAGNTMLAGDSSNTFVGYLAGLLNTGSNANTFIGGGAGNQNTSGIENTLIGEGAGLKQTTASQNTEVGFAAGNTNVNGNHDVFVGYDAGNSVNGAGDDVYIGWGAGPSATSEDFNTLIGSQADIAPGVNGSVAIGFRSQASQTGTVILGSIAGVNSSSYTTSVGIATQTPNQYLGVGGGITIDENSQNSGTDTTNTVLAFGTNGTSGMSGEAIGSQRTSSGGNQYGLDFYTLYTKRMSITNSGNVQIFGTLSKGAGSFKIDDPIDPTNKYLYHSFVESPDMKNIYDGIATLDDSGEAIVQLPHWFEALNRDFRYQLTCIGSYAPVYIAEEVSNNQFEIAGGKLGMRVSWQVTGIRHDAFANAHRIPVEEEKPPSERGTYLYPEEQAENHDPE